MLMVISMLFLSQSRLLYYKILLFNITSFRQIKQINSKYGKKKVKY